MLSFQDAFDRLIRNQPFLTTERCAVDDAVGYVLAAPVRARHSQPGAAMSAMDGYAVASASLAGSGPYSLPLMSEEAAAGKARFALTEGHSARIFTGGVMPVGADQVVIQENVTRHDGKITFADPPNPGRHVRMAGGDFAAGDGVMEAGTYISPKMVGLLAAAGASHVMVYRAPKITIIATGDELRDPDTDTLAPHQLINSNTPMIASLLREAGAAVTALPIIKDDVQALTKSLKDIDSDIVLTTGGASVGDHDLVGAAFDQIGVTRDFWKVAMRPGKPVFVGSRGSCRFIGLPGNPVSAFVTAFLLVRPLVDQMMARPVPDPVGIPLPSAVALSENGPRTHFMRARLIGDIGARHVDPAHSQDSAMLSVLAASDGLLVRPAGAPAVKAGDLVPYLPF